MASVRSFSRVLRTSLRAAARVTKQSSQTTSSGTRAGTVLSGNGISIQTNRYLTTQSSFLQSAKLESQARLQNRSITNLVSSLCVSKTCPLIVAVAPSEMSGVEEGDEDEEATLGWTKTPQIS